MRFSHILKGAALAGTLSLMSTSAMAACNSGGTYCTQNHDSGYAMLRSANPISTYSSYSSYNAPVAVADQPAAVYAYEGTSSYSTGNAYSLDTSSSNSWTLASGLGYSAGSASDVPAGMCPTTCPVSVDAPAGSRVLSCYAACPTVTVQPQPMVQAYQVVRPIVAIPYAVPVMIPNQCGPIMDAPSRYGSRYGYGRCGY